MFMYKRKSAALLRNFSEKSIYKDNKSVSTLCSIIQILPTFIYFDLPSLLNRAHLSLPVSQVAEWSLFDIYVEYCEFIILYVE